MKPVSAALEQVEFCAGVQRLLEAGGIVLAVALAGGDFFGGNDAADSVRLRVDLDNDGAKKSEHQ